MWIVSALIEDLPVCVQQVTRFHWQLHTSTATSGNVRSSLSTKSLHATSHLLQFPHYVDIKPPPSMVWISSLTPICSVSWSLSVLSSFYKKYIVDKMNSHHTVVNISTEPDYYCLLSVYSHSACRLQLSRNLIFFSVSSWLFLLMMCLAPAC